MLDKTALASPADGRGRKNSGRHIVICQYVWSVPHWFVRLLFTLYSYGLVDAELETVSCVDEGSSLMGCDTIFVGRWL